MSKAEPQNREVAWATNRFPWACWFCAFFYLLLALFHIHRQFKDLVIAFHTHPHMRTQILIPFSGFESNCSVSGRFFVWASGILQFSVSFRGKNMFLVLIHFVIFWLKLGILQGRLWSSSLVKVCLLSGICTALSLLTGVNQVGEPTGYLIL